MARILLIDDHAVFRELLESALRQRGHQVLASGDGAAGLALFHRETPDLVILDRNLPSWTGSDVLAAIRKADSRTRVIVLTAHDDKGAGKYKELGISAFLSKKDTSLAELMRIVDGLL